MNINWKSFMNFSSDREKISAAEERVSARQPAVETRVKSVQKIPVKKVSIVEQIHKEFNTAADNAIIEARRILTGILDIHVDVELLEEIGFKNAKKVQETREIRTKKEMAQKEAELIMHWQQVLPTHKFITMQQITDICNKYGLVYGYIERYIGEVPSKNVQEIAKFHKENPVPIEHRKYMKNIPRSGMWDITDESNYDAWKSFTEVKGITGYVIQMRQEYHYEDKQYLICAPQKDMNMERARVDTNTRQIVDDDPIVLYPVRGGYVIVSAWGDEATDVVNEKMN